MLTNFMKQDLKKVIERYKQLNINAFATIAIFIIIFTEGYFKWFGVAFLALSIYLILMEFETLNNIKSKKTLDFTFYTRTDEEVEMFLKNIKRMQMYGFDREVMPIVIDEDLSDKQFSKRFSKIQEYAISLENRE